MLPEAESINKDGSQVRYTLLTLCTQYATTYFVLCTYCTRVCSPVLSITFLSFQDGLMEAANIPLQSKEEDQMWKILKTDERYCQRYIIIVYSLMSLYLLFSVQFPSCVIEFTRTTLDTNIENEKWKFLHHSYDGSQTKWKPISLAKVESDINFCLYGSGTSKPLILNKELVWTSQRKEVCHILVTWTKWIKTGSIPDCSRETWTNEKERSLLDSSSNKWQSQNKM